MDQEACHGEDVLELSHRSQSLTLPRVLHLPILEHVVKQENEGAWLRFSLRGTRLLVELRLGPPQEVHQRLIVEVAGDPYHEYGIVFSPKHKVLHRSFGDATHPRVL